MSIACQTFESKKVKNKQKAICCNRISEVVHEFYLLIIHVEHQTELMDPSLGSGGPPNLSHQLITVTHDCNLYPKECKENPETFPKFFIHLTFNM